MLSLLACEAIPLMVYMWSPTALQGAFLFSSFLALAIVVAIKSVLFVRFSRIGWARGVGFMVAANVVSSVPGFLVAGLLSSSFLTWAGLLIALPLSAWIVGLFFASSLKGTQWSWLSPDRFATATFVLGAVSLVGAWILSYSAWAAEQGPAVYFTLKAAALFVGLLPGVALTIGWEGLIACSLGLRYGLDRGNILRAVVKANLWTLLGVFFLAALIALPIRLRTPGLMYYRDH
jgi:hypothetical protein